MVAWNRDQMDEDGYRVKDVVKRVLDTLKTPPRAFVSIVQGGDSAEPAVTVLTASGHRTFIVSLDTLAAGEEVLSSWVRRTLKQIYHQ